MIYLLIDLLVNRFTLLPLCMSILTLKIKNKYEIVLFLFFIGFVFYDLKIMLIFFVMYLLYQFSFKNINYFFKDIIFLTFFLVISNIFFTGNNIILCFLFNVVIYFVYYILRFIII